MASCSPRALSIGLLLLLWYSSSVVTSLTTKSILSRFPFPIAVAVVQQAVAAILSYTSWRWHTSTDAVRATPRLQCGSSELMLIALVMVMSLVRSRRPRAPDR